MTANSGRVSFHPAEAPGLHAAHSATREVQRRGRGPLRGAREQPTLQLLATLHILSWLFSPHGSGGSTAAGPPHSSQEFEEKRESDSGRKGENRTRLDGGAALHPSPPDLSGVVRVQILHLLRINTLWGSSFKPPGKHKGGGAAVAWATLQRPQILGDKMEFNGRKSSGPWCLWTSKANNRKATVNQWALREHVFRGREGVSNACGRAMEAGAACGQEPWRRSDPHQNPYKASGHRQSDLINTFSSSFTNLNPDFNNLFYKIHANTGVKLKLLQISITRQVTSLPG